MTAERRTGVQVCCTARGELLVLRVVKHERYARRVGLRLSLMHPKGRVLLGDWFGAGGCGDVFAVFVNGREVPA